MCMVWYGSKRIRLMDKALLGTNILVVLNATQQSFDRLRRVPIIGLGYVVAQCDIAMHIVWNRSKYKRTANRALPRTIVLARLREARSSLTTSGECWSRDLLCQQKHVQHGTILLWPPPRSAGRGIHYVNRSAYNMQQFMTVSRSETDKMSLCLPTTLPPLLIHPLSTSTQTIRSLGPPCITTHPNLTRSQAIVNAD